MMRASGAEDFDHAGQRCVSASTHVQCHQRLYRQLRCIKNRGVADIFIACVDGLKGFPDAIEAVFPKTAVQLCLVHMVRHSLNFVG